MAMRQMKCILCGKKQRLKELFPATLSKSNFRSELWSARRSPDRVHYRMVKCLNCGLIFSSPIFPQLKINSAYAQAKFTYADKAPYAGETYMRLFDSCQPWTTLKPKVLEVGCGTGFFLNMLWARGITNVAGIEPGRAIVKQAPKRLQGKIRKTIFKKGLFNRRQFDVIACFHTLDHMTSPKVFAQESYRLLKPKGLVIIVVHDTDGVSVKLWGEKSPIFDIEHIYLFNRSNLVKLFKRYKFKVRKIDKLVNTYPIAYWWQMSGLPKELKQFGETLLAWTGLGKIPLSLAGGNIALIAQKL